MQIIEQGVLSRQPGRGAYMPAITPISDGLFLASLHVGSGLSSPDNRIEILRSENGRDWINEGSIRGGPPADDGWSYRRPKISEVPDGRMVMTSTRFKAGSENLFDPHTEALQRPEMVLLWSNDRGASWSEPQVVPVDLPPDRTTWNGAGCLLQIAPDRWMFPLETWKPEGWAGPPDQRAMAVFSADRGRTWGELTEVANDPTGKVLYWDQMCSLLPDGRIYTLFWSHLYGTHDDLANHFTVSVDQGRCWSQPRPTNLMGQVCTPIPMADGRVAAIYNYRKDPQGIRIAVTQDLERFDVENEIIIFDAGAEATLGKPETDNFLAEHLKIGFGLPCGVQLHDGTVLVYFWCTVGGVTQSSWMRLRVS